MPAPITNPASPSLVIAGFILIITSGYTENRAFDSFWNESNGFRAIRYTFSKVNEPNLLERSAV